MKVCEILANGTVVFGDIEKGLDSFRKLVGGDCEFLGLDPDYSLSMCINENGKISNLPYNEIATTLYHSYCMTQDYIAGDAVVYGVDKEGDSCGLSEEQIGDILVRSKVNVTKVQFESEE